MPVRGAGIRGMKRLMRLNEERLMSEGLHFAALATLVGKKNAVRWGPCRVTIGAVGWKDGERFVMGTTIDGTVVLGMPQDFTIGPIKRKAPR